MVGIRRFKFVLAMFIPFFVIFSMSQNIFAAEFNRWLNIQHISRTNLNNNWTTYNVVNAGSYAVAGASSLETYRLSASANLSSPATGAYYSASGDIYLDVGSSLQGGVLCNLIDSAAIMPEYVSYNSSSSVLSSCTESFFNPYQRRYTLHIESSGSIPSQAMFSSFSWTIGNSSNQPIISLVGTPDDNPGVVVSGNINISIGTSPELEGLGVINQNITVISSDLKDMKQQMSDNTDAIINNQNDNTDALIDNQNENTDAIIKSNQHCFQSSNLFTGWTIGQRLSPTDGSVYNNANSAVSTDFIPVESSTNYFVSGLPSDLYTFLAAYNSSYQFLGRTSATGRSSLGFKTVLSDFPSGTAQGSGDISYVRITAYQSSNYQGSISQVTSLPTQLEKGTSPTEYNPNGEVCKNYNEEYYDEQRQADQNISNQSTSDIDGAENQATTNLIGVLSGFISAFSNISATNCNLTLDFPTYAGGSRVVDICQGKEKAPRIVEIGSSLLLIGVFVPLAYILIKMIYNEIRSWTNG